LKKVSEDLKETKIASSFIFLNQIASIVEKARIAADTRITHLGKRQTRDEITEEVAKEIKALEKKIDDRFISYVESHPAFHWFSGIQGIGPENIAKILPYIDIKKAKTISSLWHYAGYHVVDGRAPKNISGKASDFNGHLRTMCYRLALSLLKGKGKFKKYYDEVKSEYKKRFQKDGYKIINQKKGSKSKKKSAEKQTKTISAGYIHNLALRKMIKRFLACLWLVWKEAIGEKPAKPYAFAVLHHDPNHFINPWEYVDLTPEQAKKKWAKIVKKSKRKGQKLQNNKL